MPAKYRLNNNMTVLLAPLPGVVSVSVGLWVHAGSRHENENQMGYAHLIEHMLFKGTEKYSARDIARLVDRVGGHHNAATSREYTTYYINVMSNYLDLALSILSETYSRSVFDKVELEKEKNVVLEEIRMYEDSPDELIHDVFMECMLAEHPLGHPILGTVDTIKNTDRSSLIDFYNETYRDEKSLLVVVGNIDVEQTKNMIAGHFFRPAVTPVDIIPNGTPRPNRIKRKHIQKDLEQVHFCIGADGLKKGEPERWSYYIMSTVLGGSMSSRLFQHVREDEGLCYNIYCFHSSYSDEGVFGIYCGTSPENYSKTIELIEHECTDFLVNSITEEELEDAKTFMKGNIALSLESTEVQMGQLARHEMVYGRTFTFQEISEQIDAVTLKDVQDITSRVFSPNDFALVTTGNLPRGSRDNFSLKI
ncbi:MAG: M16 family metallopeptidase [Spirochaetota bacterium]